MWKCYGEYNTTFYYSKIVFYSGTHRNRVILMNESDQKLTTLLNINNIILFTETFNLFVTNQLTTNNY